VLARRLLLAVIAAVVALLLIEGGLSLLAGRSLRHGGRERPSPAAPAPLPPTDEQRRAGLSSLAFATHEDPLVRYTLWPDSEVVFAGAAAHIDASGQRVRPGPPPPENALRLVVLGDSVAFGYGLSDEQTLAAQLESLLAASRGTEARPLACFTVAAPSWNHRSALACLRDHWDTLRPDIVVYVPVANDLSDASDLSVGGAQRLAPDPSAPDPWLLVSRSQLAAVEARLSPAWNEPELGPVALEGDFSPESSRRYDENAASIVALQDLCAARGSRLLVIHSELFDYPWHLGRRLQALRPELELLFLERFVPQDFQLEGDLHPNAETVHQRALAVARRLLELGYVDRGADVPLPEISEAFAAVLSRPGDRDQFEARDAKARSEALARLRPAVDLRTGEGLHQVFGGLNIDGSVRMHLLAVLAATGETLDVRLAPLPGRPDALPLAVQVDLDGERLGSLELSAEGARARLPLPAAVARSGRPIEVRLRPASWVVIKDFGRSEVASCYLVRLDAGR
jgi:hypothetical protein